MTEPTLPVAVRHLDSIQDKLQRIRALHQHVSRGGYELCDHCIRRWPCPTVSILDSPSGFGVGDDPPDFVPLEKVRC